MLENKNILLFLLLLFSVLGNTDILEAQKVLLLEPSYEIKPIKFFIGDNIDVKFTYEDEYIGDKIDDLLLLDSIIIFRRAGLVKLRDIEKIRLSNKVGLAVSRMLITFGVGWLGYGGIAAGVGRYDFNAGTLAIGSVAMGVGYLTHKVAGYKRYKIGKRHRLRIIDLTIGD
jgi:hypothetical protein